MTNLEQMREGWDRYASSYDEAITQFGMRVGEDALRHAGVEPGATLLDIAAGGGSISIPAAKLGAQVTATDFSTAMVSLLEAKATDLGLTNLSARVMDGTALELEDGSFDFCCSQWGIMLFPDRSKGLSEMARVTKPGGKGVMVVFGPPPKVGFFFVFFQALMSAVPGFKPPANSPLFSLQDPAQLRAEMLEAGFSEVRVETMEHTFKFASADALWNTLQNATPAVAGMLQQFSAEQITAAKSALNQRLREERGDGPYSLPGMTHVGIGLK